MDLTPEPLQHVFFSDSGSVAVEVAIKMALQFWQARDRPAKRRLLALRGGYHGDTFGAMAVYDPVNGMHQLFRGVLPEHLFAPRPGSRFGWPLEPRDAAFGSVPGEPPLIDGLSLRVEPRVQSALHLAALRLVLGLAAAAGVAGLVVLRRALGREEKAVARERAFLSGVTHELRTPLTTIRRHWDR